LAEAAVVLTLLVLVTLGAIKYGWLFFRLHQTTNAAREGARRAILPGAVQTDVDTAVASVMSFGNVTGYTVNISPAIDVAAGTEIRVRIIVPTANVDLLPISLLPAPANLTGTVTMAKEG
jgi:hypothetical protein